jgi:adenosylmethionine-8-amino-7-oxononanoate aminotransferase
VIVYRKKEMTSSLILGGLSNSRMPDGKTLTMEAAKGCFVWVTGETAPYIDLMSGAFVTNLGHSHPSVVQAVQRQASRLAFCSHTEGQVADIAEVYCNRLIKRTGIHGGVFLTCSGSDGIEAALFIALQRAASLGESRRERIIVTEKGYHGATYLARQLSRAGGWHLAFWPGFRAARDVIPVPSSTDSAERSLDTIKQIIKNRSDKILAVVIEPVALTGGVTAPPEGWLMELQSLCSAAGIVVIADEMVTGFGRTGALWASQEQMEGQIPDLLVFGKAATSGLGVLAGVVMKEDISALLRSNMFPHGHTYCGHPLSCAAALATIDELTNEIINKALKQGDMIKTHLERELVGNYPYVVSVRNFGMLLSIDLEDELFAGTDNGHAITQALQRSLWKHRVLARVGNRIVLAPALNIENRELYAGLDSLIVALSQTFEECGWS